MYVILKFRCFILLDVKEICHVEQILNTNNIEILMLKLPYCKLSYYKISCQHKFTLVVPKARTSIIIQ